MNAATANGQDCAILIPTRNRPGFLADSLAHLMETELRHMPLFVYDDASEDGVAVRDACKIWPGATVVRGEKRVGQAAGRNNLLHKCGTSFALMLEDDTYVGDPGPLFSYLGQPLEGRCPAVVTFQCTRIHDGASAISAATRHGPSESFLGGACLFHVPSVLSVGGYREFFVYGGEEPELAIRLWLKGFEMLYDARVKVIHNHRLTEDAARNLREYDFLYSRNFLLTMTMNFQAWFSVPLGVLRALKFALGKGRHHRSALAGLLAGLRETIAHRKERGPASWRRFKERRRYENECRNAK